jgi:hypothetical protein
MAVRFTPRQINSGTTVDSTLTNCTLSGNSASVAGGAVYNTAATSGNAYTSLTDCTLSGNSAPDGGGIYNFASGDNVVNNGGTVQSSGNNLTSDNTGFTSNSGDIRNTDPMLGPFAFNGGFTQTHALLSGSPAINAGTSFFAPTQDQRGFFYAGANDIGAYEFNGIELRITSITRLSNGHVVLQGIGVANTIYKVQRSLTTPDGASFGFLSNTTAGGAGLIHFTDTTATGLSKAFYRLAP